LSSLNVTGAITSGDITSSNIISGTSFRGGLGSISAPTFSFTSDPNTGIFSPSADILGFVTSGTERMRIDANGIGVNTSGQTRTISTYYGANSDGENIFIGGGGTSSVGELEETYKGSYNTSVGVSALLFNTTGHNNSAMGVSALLHNTTGYFNSAMGMAALVYNTTGYNNTGLGFGAGYSLSDNIPNKRITSDYDMTLIGYGATKNSASQLNNSIAIGVGTLVTASNTAMWGNASMTSHIFQAGNVGIGTTNPTVALQVVGAITASGIISGTGSGLTNLNASNISSGTIPAASVVGAYPNITGVGTLSSLNVTGAITSGDITSSNIISGTSFRGGLGSISAPTFSFTSDPNTGIFSPSADILGFVTSGTERMRIDANGNVGIGTTSPGNKLEVKGAGTDAVENVLGVYNTLTPGTAKGKGAAIQLGWSNAQYYSKIATIFESRNPDYLRPSLAFFTMDESDTVSSERLRISSAGNVGIGTTNPQNRLHVQGTNSGSAGIYLNNAVPSNTSYTLYNDNGALSWSGSEVSVVFSTSDLRLKENISPITSALSVISNIDGMSFNMIGSSDTEYGFIAQDVQKYLPNAVKIVDPSTGYLGINYLAFTPYLVEAIQEQQLQISGISSNLSTLTEELDLKLNEETGEIVTSINSLINSTSATNDLINLNQTANITTITALDSRVEVLENYSLDISDFQASASATLSELNQRIGLIEQIMSLTSTDSATLSASSALESLIDSRILGAFTSQIATFSALTVTSGANINNLAVTGNITNGLLTINGFDDSLATPSATLSTLSGPLKIQHQALGEIDFMGGKAIIDTNGDFKIITGDFEISSGVIKGNNQFRGFDLSITPNSLEVDVIFETNRLSNEYTVSVLPSWLTNVAIIQKRTDGFKIKFSNPAPVDAKIDWLIIE
jgi:hypothetical protein